MLYLFLYCFSNGIVIYGLALHGQSVRSSGGLRQDDTQYDIYRKADASTKYQYRKDQSYPHRILDSKIGSYTGTDTRDDLVIRVFKQFLPLWVFWAGQDR